MWDTKSLSASPVYSGAVMPFIMRSSASLNAGVDGPDPAPGELNMYIPAIDALCWAFAGRPDIANVMQARTEAVRRAVELCILNLLDGKVTLGSGDMDGGGAT